MTRDAAKGVVYLKLVNAASVPQAVDIDLTGAGSVAKTGTLVTLGAPTLAATNTIVAPKRIVPVKTTLSNAGAKFSHSVPAYSIQVLELQAK